MTIVYAGFTDVNQIKFLGSGCTIQTTHPGKNGFSLKQGGVADSTLINGLSFTQGSLRVRVFIPATVTNQTFLIENASSRLECRINNGFVGVIDASPGATLGLTPTNGTIPITAGTYFRLELVYDLAAGGVVKTWINGVPDINITHTSDVSATPTDSWRTFAPASPNEWYFADVEIDAGTLTPTGDAPANGIVPYSLGTGTTTNPAGSYSITTTADAPKGSVIIVATSMGNQAGPAVTNVTDSAGNTYAQVDSISNPNANPNPSWTDVWACLNSATNLPLGGSITITYGSTGNRAAIVCIPSLGSIAAIDIKTQTAVGTGTSPPTVVTSGPLNHANEILIGIAEGQAGSPVYSPSAGFTSIVTSVSAVQSVYLAYQNVTDATSKSWQPTWTGATALWTTDLISIQTGADPVAANTNAPGGGGNPDAYKRKQKRWRIKLPDGRFLSGIGSKSYQQALSDLRAEDARLALEQAVEPPKLAMGAFKSKVTKRLAKRGNILPLQTVRAPRAIPIPIKQDDDDEEDIEMILRAL